eukprot:jgi/Tetstr1/441251/TSEL_029502.t1
MAQVAEKFPWLARYREACSEAGTHLAREVDDAEPYKWQYAAAEALAGGRLALESCSAVAGEEQQQGRTAALAVLDCRRGLALLETDLLPDGEGAVLSGLQLFASLPASLTAAYLALRLEALNALGALACNRDSYDQAQGHLEVAQKLLAEAGGESAGQPVVPDYLGQAHGEDALQRQHTLTFFYLAQVYGHQGDKPKSAEFCGITLCRQLTSGGYDKDDWLQNCTQLAGFYLGEGCVRCCHYMLSAAMALLKHEKSAGASVAEEVEANVHLGWGKMLMVRLADSAAARGAGRELLSEDERQALLCIPEHLRFDKLGISVSKPEQVAELATFEAAREAFNDSIRHFNEAMKCYTAEAWFTEHFEILMDISNLYRSLVAFEPDTHRRCIMHKHRIKALEKLADDINSKLYLGLYRSAQLECGNVYRDISEIKAADGREPGKVAQAALKAIGYLEKFLETYEEELSSGKRIEPDSERHWLNAQFALGSLYNKLQPTLGSAGMANLDTNVFKQSIRHSRNVAEYVKKHGVLDFKAEADLCAEMADLLEQKLKMIR